MNCFYCDEDRSDVEVVADPFCLEINDEEWLIPLCSDCYQLRCDEI